jgi:hypothetical protein
MKRLKIVALALLAFMALPYAAIAADIPLLTWERGRQQQVAFAVGTENRSWDVQLISEEGVDIPFTKSSQSTAGFVVYTLTLPDQLDSGSYSVVAKNDQGTSKVIAGVLVIEAITRTASDNLFDLTMIIALFAALTALISTLRARKYSVIPFKTAQRIDDLAFEIGRPDANFWTRLEEAPYRFRIQAINSLRISLLRLLLIREGEFSHRLSRRIYGISPLLSLMVGVFVSAQIFQEGGFATLTIATLLILLAISIWDALSGIFITLGFWMIQLFTGNVTSVRDLLIQIAIGITLVGPSLFASLLRDAINQDAFFVKKRSHNSSPVVGILGSALVGTGLFYLGHSLLMSIIYTEAPQLEITFAQLLIIYGALALRGFAGISPIESEIKSEIESEIESDGAQGAFYIARTTSPITTVVIAALIGSFTFIWTENLGNSLAVSMIYSLPYLLSFIGLKKRSITLLGKFPRNLLIEAVIVGAVVLVMYMEISGQPVLLDQRIESLLLLGGLPALIHSVYSAIYAAQEETFTSTDNHGRIGI